MQCMLQDKSCRSANFRKTSGGTENCELLKTVYSEEQPVSLKKDENFDYYILLQPDRVSILSEYVFMRKVYRKLDQFSYIFQNKII